MIDINVLKPKTFADEHRFGVLASEILYGREVDGHWLQIAKTNTPKKKDDTAIYEVDFATLKDGEVIGYLDIEYKPGWKAGNWSYPVTNIARHPMAQWAEHRIDGRLTNKLIRFHEKPEMSFWVGIRADWAACWVISALDLFAHGERTTQDTRYNNDPLPVIQVSNIYGAFCDSADSLAALLEKHYREHYHAKN